MRDDDIRKESIQGRWEWDEETEIENEKPPTRDRQNAKLNLGFTSTLSPIDGVAVFGAFAALYLRRFESFSYENNVYAQIDLIMLIGRAAKNAILIVEFAKAEHEKGRSLADAALEGARLRLRPILMTSFAFILGCVLLWKASGSGAISRRVTGTAVIGGMLAASAIAIFIIPALFYMIERLGGAKVEGMVPKRTESGTSSPDQSDCGH